VGKWKTIGKRFKSRIKKLKSRGKRLVNRRRLEKMYRLKIRF